MGKGCQSMSRCVGGVGAGGTAAVAVLYATAASQPTSDAASLRVSCQRYSTLATSPEPAAAGIGPLGWTSLYYQFSAEKIRADAAAQPLAPVLLYLGAAMCFALDVQRTQFGLLSTSTSYGKCSA